MAKANIYEPRFWQRRFYAFAGPPSERADTISAQNHEMTEADHSLEGDSFDARGALAAVTNAVSPTEDVDKRPHREIQHRETSKRRAASSVRTITSNNNLTASNIHTFADLAEILRRDALHSILLAREAIWDHLLNRHLYHRPFVTSNLLLFGAVLLFLCNNFWSGVAVLIAAFYWRARSNG